MLKLSDLKCITNIEIDKYLEISNDIKKEMENPSFLGDIDKNTLQLMLENGAKIWVYYDKDIVVSSMMIIPSDDNSLKKLEVDNKKDDVIDYGPMFVSKKYRGNHLQYQMLNFLDCYCRKEGYKYALSTIDPKNIYSINNLQKDGFNYLNTKKLKRGIRNIYLKKL